MKMIYESKLLKTASTSAALAVLERKILPAWSLDETLSVIASFRENLLLPETQSFLCKTSAEESSEADTRFALKEITDFLEEGALRKKILRELGDHQPFLLRKSRSGHEFEAWRSIGTVLHVTPGNALTVPFLAAIESLICGNENIVKLSSSASDFHFELFALLGKCDAKGTVAARMHAFKFSSKENSTWSELIERCDAVSAWGGEEAIASLRSQTPPQKRFLEWGHKISFAYLTKGAINSQNLRSLAESIALFEQQACASPQVVYLDTNSFADLCSLAEKLGYELDLTTDPSFWPDDAEAAEITKVVNVHRAEACLKQAKVFAGKNWRILVEDTPELRASPLFRTIFVKPLPQAAIEEFLSPMRPYLQTAGLGCDRSEVASLSTQLLNAGVLRIRDLGQMLSSYSGEPHDGVYAMQRFCSRVSIELSQLTAFSSLNELQGNEQEHLSGPVLSKEKFEQAPQHEEVADLFFRSGGSSGAPKLSTFSYTDYHLQMRYAADGLVAAGLNVGTDRCMNLFHAGGLYGGFLSFFTILEDLQAKQFPMAAHLDYVSVGQTIVEKEVNVLLGMPSYLEVLFEKNAELFRKNPTIKKIFFGGEHFSPSQRNRLQKEYGVELIRSATYGSVDAGPLGFQCSASEGSVHHLHADLQNLEILELESEKIPPPNHPGRLIFTSKMRSSISLHRYEIGDLGRWIAGPCPCGRTQPRFELMGRFGDIFRAAGCFFNYGKISRLLDSAGYTYELQIVLRKEGKIDQMELRLDDRSDLSLREEFLCSQLPDLKEVMDEGSLKLKITKIKNQDFLRTASSGKLRHIVDERTR